MSSKALFAGLIVDEMDHPVDSVMVGAESFYVVDDAGFRRHISSEYVDVQVLQSMKEMIEGHEDLIGDQTAKMLGQDDIFSRAMIEKQIRNIDQQFTALFETGIPEEVRAYMGMAGLRIKINVHGDIIEITQPGMIDPDSE